MNATAQNKPESTICSIPVLAQFPGGEKALKEYIEQQLIYPIDAFEKEIEGQVILRFVIRKTGKIDKIEIQKSLFASCDSAAIRVVKSMPDWDLSSINKQPIDIFYTLPVSFKLDNFRKKYPEFCSCRDSIKSLSGDNTIYPYVEESSQFPGGDKALLKYIKENIYYPPTEACIQGKVIIRFIVTPEGKIECPVVVRSLDKRLDNIALEMVRSMPEWISGKQDSKPVYSYFLLIVSFKLE
jgi:TonB family protein